MDTKFERKGKTIRDIENNTSKTYASINKAKKESAILQRSNGGLGLGSLIAT